MTTQPQGTLTRDVAHVARGVMMGGADIIPGVSGGTVALILGIYERLVTAISHFDLTLLSHLRRSEWREALAHIDARFLLALGMGVGTGIVGLSSVMNYLLIEQRTPTLAAFFGLILASSILVGRMVPRWGAATAALFAAGVLFAFWLVGRLPTTAPEGYLYLFFTGAVAICAMILPGISGAFILLIMGKYEDITGIIRGLVHGEVHLEALLTLAIFASGCTIGLISFSKVLRWLLARHQPQTLAVLCGFMLGSLRKIWPFKIDITPEETDIKHKFFENVWPDAVSTEVLSAAALAIGAALAVFLIDWMARDRQPQAPPLESADHEPQPADWSE